MKTQLREIRRSGYLEVHERVDLKAWTTLGIGGPAELVLSCHCVSALQDVVDLLAAHGSHWVLLGSGSHLVPADDGLRLPVLRLSGELASWHFDGGTLIAGGGANMTRIGRALAQMGPPGRGVSCPGRGTVGGILKTAARRPSATLAASCRWIDVVRPGARTARTEVAGATTLSQLLADGRSVIADAGFSVNEAHGTNRQHSDAALDLLAIARPRQLLGVFLDLPHESAEELLRRSGCDGMNVGGAWLGGDRVNSINVSRSCSANDLVAVLRRVRNEVRVLTGSELETCVRCLDRDGRRIEL